MIYALMAALLFAQSGTEQGAVAAGRRMDPPPAASQAGRDWVVVVAAPVYLPDGSARTETVTLPTAGAGLVHLFSRKTLCAPASSGAAEPTDASFGWRVASQIVTRSENGVVVSLDWRRLWDGGKKIGNGPSGTVQLTLDAGDRIPLDHLANAAPTADCRAVGLGLEIRLARMPAAATEASESSLPIGATPGGAKAINAEMWLTHISPAGTEQVVHQVVRVAEAGGRFSFAPTSLVTSRGEISLELTGNIDRYRSPNGLEFMRVSMSRVVNGGGLPSTGVRGSTAAIVPMPDANTVLSFEMTSSSGARGRGGVSAGPVARGGGAGGARGGDLSQVVSGGGGRGGRGGGGGVTAAPTQNNLASVQVLLEGHQFSLRMQVTQVQ